MEHSSGTFYYQRYGAVKAMNLIVLCLTLLVTALVSRVVNSALVMVLTFVVTLVVLAVITVPIMQKKFYLQGEYEFTPEQLIFRMNKTVTIPRAEVKFAHCAPLKEKRGNPDRTWCIQINTKGVKGDIHKIYSVDKEPQNQTSIDRVNGFLDMARRFCDEVDGGAEG